MAVVWSLVLVFYAQFEPPPVVAWLLLIPFIYQDLYDGAARKHRRNQ